MKAFIFFIISTAQHLGVVLQPLSQPFVFHLALQEMIQFVVESLERIMRIPFRNQVFKLLIAKVSFQKLAFLDLKTWFLL
jgi:hypothetical protein